MEETHADTRRTYRLHTDSDPSQKSNPGPWSCEAAVLTTCAARKANRSKQMKEKITCLLP